MPERVRSKRVTSAVQLELPHTRKRDKNKQFRGGARPGAGRPKRERSQGRSSEPHRVRPEINARYPLHVVMRASAEVGSLRVYETYLAIREATNVALGWGESFRIIHYSIQRTHLHLIVEAADRKALWRGMHAFGISCARQINAALTARRGEKRVGAVFSDRYFARALRNPRSVRNCLAYVLNNWRHHGEDRAGRTPSRRAWKIDPLSSAFAFDGWAERADRRRFKIPPDYEGGVVWTPSTWLLREGWRRHAPISVFEVPGGSDE